MKSQPRPYIGITGICSLADVEILRGLPISTTHRLMAGVLVSRKTMSGEIVPSKRYPAYARAKEIVDALAIFAFPVIHYNGPSLFVHDLMSLADSIPSIQGIQLNLALPEVDQIFEFKRRFPKIEIIIQANKTSVQKMNGDHCAFIRRYDGVADHYLIDSSGGRGEPLSVDESVIILNRIQKTCEECGVTPGIAGGLSNQNTFKISSVIHQHKSKHFSVDTETGVRVIADDAIPDEKHQDQLSERKAVEFYAGVKSCFDA